MCNIVENLDEEAEATETANDLTGTSLLDILQPRLDGDIPMVTLMQ